MEVISLGSSSRGNAFVFRTARSTVLVDAGFPQRVLREGLLRCGIGDNELTAILITHEHSDHIRGLTGILRWQTCPVVATPGTLRALRLEVTRGYPLLPGEWTEIGDLAFQPVPVPHDATEPIGLSVATASVRAALFTDLGSLTPDVEQAIRRASLVIIEANHDRTLLESGPYPYWLKRRIASPYGHLSNDDAAEAARRCSERLQTLWLAHLSEENNRPELAITSVRRSLQPSFHIDVRTVPPRGLLRWSSLAPHERSVE